MKYRASPWYNKAMLNDKPLFQYYQHIAQDLLSNLFFHQLLKFPKEHFPVPQTNKARLVMMKTHHQKIRAKLYLFMLMLMASQLIRFEEVPSGRARESSRERLRDGRLPRCVLVSLPGAVFRVKFEICLPSRDVGVGEHF